MSHCSCRISCRCVAPRDSQEILRVNNGQQIQVASPHVLHNLFGAQIGMNSQDLQSMTLSMGAAMQNISITQRDNAAALLVMADTQRITAKERLVAAEAQRDMAVAMQTMADSQRVTAEERLVTAEAQRATAQAQLLTAEAQQQLFKEVADYRRELQELKEMIEATRESGNVQVGFVESVENSIGRSDADKLRATCQPGKNEATSNPQQNPAPSNTYWEEFQEFSNLEKGLTIAALAAVTGAVGWGSWAWVVPWVWPNLLSLFEMVKLNAPFYTYKLLSFLFDQAKNIWEARDLQSSVVTFVNSGYFSLLHNMVPGFVAMLVFFLQPNTPGTQN